MGPDTKQVPGRHAQFPGLKQAPIGACASGGVFVLVVLGRHIILRHFASSHLGNIGRLALFYALNHIGFEGVSLFEKFVYAFRICACNA